jgi:hypothetical protein
VILAGARRFLLIIGVLTGGTAAGAAAIGLVSGNGLNRTISLGFYAIGSFCTIVGFALTMRGALRPGTPTEDGSDDVAALRGTSALLISAGLILVVLGVVVDSRVRVI